MKDEKIKEIIQTFLTEGRIFSNEAQFQFELALAIKEIKGAEVRLEYLTPKETNEGTLVNKKSYTDIVVKLDAEYYVIELKYKTADKNIKYTNEDETQTKYTYCQGASDNASYDYLEDISRLEYLVLNENKLVAFDSDSKTTPVAGYAIIISNEPLIWGEGKRSIKNSPWKNFFLINKEKKSGNLLWNNNGNEVKKLESKKPRENSISLEKEYYLVWKDYEIKPFEEKDEKGKAHPFKYLITKIEK